jgi:glycosyl transferase, family 25
MVIEEVSFMRRQCSLPPIWVLNLRRSVERRARIRDHLGALGLPFEIIEGVDGRAMTPRDLAAVSSSRESLRLAGRELTPGEIGCSLSHLELYRKQIDEGWDEVVILEDDALVDPAFVEVMKRIESLPADWELVLLYHGHPQISFWGSRRLGCYRCVKFASTAWGTVGYLLRRSGAQKLLAHGFPVRVTADHLTGGGLRAGVSLYGILPPCIREMSMEVGGSTMPEASAVRKKWPTREELGPALWVIHQWKWCLIHFCRRANPFSIV